MNKMHPAQKAAIEFEADSIERCRNDPAVAAAGLCPVCMCLPPCLCQRQATLQKMREFYEANRRTMLRSEPVLNLSWGEKGDGLMDGLYRIASENHQKEIYRLRERGPR